MAEIPKAIAALLACLESGNWDGFERYLTPDVLYDASVPGWRYRRSGADVVLKELREEWTGKHSWRVVELNCAEFDGGALLELEVRGRCPGDSDHGPHDEACRMANIFTLSDGRISEHRFYCCGEWDEETIRRVDDELNAVTVTADSGR